MAARIICLASAKGGAGKTVLAATFAQILVALDKRVLLVDTDAATNGLSLLYLHEVVSHRGRVGADEHQPEGVFDIRGGSDASVMTLEGGADFLPATYRFGNTEEVSSDAYEARLRTALVAVRPMYDYILLDAQAGADPVARVAMSRDVSDGVVLVSEYDPLSAAGIDRLKGLLAEDLTYERTWILINKMLPEFATALGEFLEVARYLSPIPWDADVVRAYARRTLALDLERGNDYTVAVLKTLRGLVGVEGEKEIDIWIESKAGVLREPVDMQLRDLEMEQKGLIVERAELEAGQRRRRVITTAGLTYGTVAAGVGAYLLTTNSTTAGLTLVAIAGGLLSAATAWFSGQKRSDVEARVADAGLRLQEASLEQRLKTLHALSEAEPEELLRGRFGSR